jgi:hypothetical protein
MSSVQPKETVQEANGLLVFDVLRYALMRKMPLFVGVKIGVLGSGCVWFVSDTDATTQGNVVHVWAKALKDALSNMSKAA